MVERWSPVSEPRPYTVFRNTVHSGKRVNVEQSDLKCRYLNGTAAGTQ
jgi:hypothetical protein